MGSHKKLFGILLISLLAVTGSFAMLVNYLSNEVEATVEVGSPISLEMHNAIAWVTEESASLADALGGDTINVSFREINLNPETAINGTIRIEISSANEIPLVKAEIAKLSFIEYNRDLNDGKCYLTSMIAGNINGAEQDITSLIRNNNGVLIVEADTTLVKDQNCVGFNGFLTLADNAIGDYVINVQVIPRVE